MKKFFISKFIIFLIFLIMGSAIYTLSSYFLDLRFNDVFFKISTFMLNKRPDNKVVLVVIDNKSLEMLSWPWKRDLYSDIFDFLEKASVKSIVFQNLVLFPDTYNPKNDAIFYSRLKNQKHLINSYVLLNSNISGDVLPDDYFSLFESKSNVNIIDKREKHKNYSYKGVVKIPKQFLENVNYLASSIIPEDKDEIVRAYMPVVSLQNKLYPSVALSAYAMYSGIYDYILTDDMLCSADNCQSLKMPVYTTKIKDYIGNKFYSVLTYYNWYKPSGKYYTHKIYSAFDVIESYNAIQNGNQPIISLDEFKDKIVVVGLNADNSVWELLSETPILKKQADIDVHATIIDNMLENKFFSTNSVDYTLIITIIFCIFILRGFRKLGNNLIFTSVLALVYFIYFVYEHLLNIYVPPVTPILTMYIVAFFKKTFDVVTTDKTSEMIKKVLGKYVSKDVMKKVLSDIDKLELGGIRSVVTILFVDIRNFTQISETLAPHELSSVLNEYFSTIEPLIGKYHGIVNKYMGDGLLAIFGEPVKTSQHALNAVKCGLEIIEVVAKLRDKFIKEGKPIINIGIGINTGEVFVGNIGTEERLEYTAIGDNVNLAYRIESYNQILKTQFLISEDTYYLVKDYIDVIKLSNISIKGKSKPIDIYEVLKYKNNVR